jgi:curved DNA-binding protein CbpA
VPPLDPIPQFDLYAELDVAPSADALVIERAWRAGVRSVHPDRAGAGHERVATQRTARLNIARDWLLDPAKRARYDELRRPAPRAPTVEVPYIDPLGAWPARPRARARRRERSAMLSRRLIAVGLVTMAIALVVGIQANPLSSVAFGLSLVTVIWFGWFALVGVLVGAWYRWRGS